MRLVSSLKISSVVSDFNLFMTVICRIVICAGEQIEALTQGLCISQTFFGENGTFEISGSVLSQSYFREKNTRIRSINIFIFKRYE